MARKKKSVVLTPWEGLPDRFSPEGYVGFVYEIVNTLTDKRYVGKKFFWTKRKVKIKGKKRKVRITKESNWREYKSSSDDLKKDIKLLGIDNFKFVILSLHKSKAKVNYTEVKEQFAKDVLYSTLSSGEYAFYNHCILGRYFR